MSQYTRLVAAAAIAVAGLVPLSQAVEVVVQNDDLEAGQTAALQLGFVAGEQAATWLKAPCDGSIVAVQVFWLNQPQAPGTSIEEAIYIYADAGTYPVPGDILAFLEAPQMSAGFLNEFRFLDENNQVPIDVPVNSSDIFVVSFEFANTPSASGPTIATDVSGCQSGLTSIFSTGGIGVGWLPPCPFPGPIPVEISGDFIIRAVVDCAETTAGACCLPDGSCATLTPSECSDQLGIFQGVLTSCSQVNCPVPDGACCLEVSGACLDRKQSVCLQLGGVWSGAGTTCASTVCFPIGACCLPNGTCVDEQSPDDCAVLGGTFQGDGTTCGEVTCPDPLGACCTITGACVIETEAVCDLAGGTWSGPGSDCSDNNANSTPDACEPITLGDVNCDGEVNASDISPFIRALLSPDNYEATYPNCDRLSADINESGDVDASDISPFVRLLLGN